MPAEHIVHPWDECMDKFSSQKQGGKAYIDRAAGKAHRHSKWFFMDVRMLSSKVPSHCATDQNVKVQRQITKKKAITLWTCLAHQLFICETEDSQPSTTSTKEKSLAQYLEYLSQDSKGGHNVIVNVYTILYYELFSSFYKKKDQHHCQSSH